MSGPYHADQKIDHYEILSRLPDYQGYHRYLAQDWQRFQHVVLYFPADALRQRTRQSRWFERETRLSTALEHPSLQHALNQRERRQEPYLVLEDLPGSTLRDRIEQAGATPLEVEQVLQIMTAVCEALASLHEQDIVHRDLKPEHIVLLETGAVKVTGLGLAEEVGTVRWQWEHIGFPVGTPDYLAPEMWWGHPGSVKADIYAVGVILYELLSGQPPFGHTTFYRLVVPQLAYDPPDLLQRQPTLPPALTTVVMRAIRRNPARRYASIQELLTDLHHLDRVQPVAYIPDPPAVGGSYKVLLLLVFIILVLLAGLISCGVLAQVLHQALTQGVLPILAAAREASN